MGNPCIVANRCPESNRGLRFQSEGSKAKQLQSRPSTTTCAAPPRIRRRRKATVEQASLPVRTSNSPIPTARPTRHLWPAASRCVLALPRATRQKSMGSPGCIVCHIPDIYVPAGFAGHIRKSGNTSMLRLSAPSTLRSRATGRWQYQRFLTIIGIQTQAAGTISVLLSGPAENAIHVRGRNRNAATSRS